MDPDQTAPKESSLIWVHTICNIRYQSMKADERADGNCLQLEWGKQVNLHCHRLYN